MKNNFSIKKLVCLIFLFLGIYCSAFEINDAYESQLNALIDLYDQLDGSNWFPCNWNHSLKVDPFCQWCGIECGGINQTEIVKISLPNNNLKGMIPNSIGDLDKMINIDLSTNSIT